MQIFSFRKNIAGDKNFDDSTGGKLNDYSTKKLVSEEKYVKNTDSVSKTLNSSVVDNGRESYKGSAKTDSNSNSDFGRVTQALGGNCKTVNNSPCKKDVVTESNDEKASQQNIEHDNINERGIMQKTDDKSVKEQTQVEGFNKQSIEKSENSYIQTNIKQNTEKVSDKTDTFASPKSLNDNPIKFIGYKNVIGDDPTLSRNQDTRLDSNKMPLIHLNSKTSKTTRYSQTYFLLT